MTESTHYRNASYALIGGLRGLLTHGEHVEVRGSEIRELRNHISVLERPRERCIILPKRHNNIFATIAETMWVLAGRNDLTYLSHYLPKAKDFSDDGLTWRAAYGLRLRRWYGVDQLKEVARLLQAEPATRRAVMAIFDPVQDYQESKDIPCNNWLDWLIRDGRLHLAIALRSNDAIWGFSGINSFEWSVLHEMMAYWAGVPVGEATFFATSFHLYKHHDMRAQAIVAHAPGSTWYSRGGTAPLFATDLAAFDHVLQQWFVLESSLRTDAAAVDREVTHFPDPLLRQFLAMLQLYNGLQQDWSDQQLAQYIGAMPENDLTAAAFEYISGKRPDVVSLVSGHQPIKIWLEEDFGFMTGSADLQPGTNA